MFLFLLFITSEAQAVTLTSSQTNYTTTADITESASGIISSLVGSSGSLNEIKNSYTITTGNSGGTSSAYGIKVSSSYNQITNDSGATIATTGSSGRGISISDYSTVINSGTITTQGTTSYGIYAGGDSNTVSNSGSITTINTTAYGIYANGNSNSVTNSGSIATRVYGIYGNGDTNTITNSGTITTTSGSSAYGIYVSAGTSSGASSTSYSTVSNSGTISSNSHGIYFKDDYTQVTNSGTIATASSSSIYGINSDADNATITNSSSGTITATKYAIYNSGSSTVINNSGTLTGGVRLGSGTLNIFGGTISGTVDGSSGSGSVNIGSSSYTSVNFSQSSSFSDLNILSINSGSTLTSSSDITADSILIDEDSTLVIGSGSSISGSIKGLSDSTGILKISGTDFSPSDMIGASGNSLSVVNINSDASLTSTNNIYTADILLGGSLNFYGSDSLTISGNLTGQGSGVVDVGSNSQKIGGNFTLQSGDSLAVTLKNGGVGNFTSDGAVAVASDSKLAITTSSDQGYIASGTEYTLVSGSSSSVIDAISSSNISVNSTGSNIYGLLKFTTEASSDSLILNISRLSASEITSNKNSQNIYNNLDKIGSAATGKLLEFQEYLGTASDVENSLKQLEPQSNKMLLTNSINAVNNSLRAVETRLGKLRKNSGNNLQQILWTQAFGNSVVQDAAGDDDGYKANSIGLAIGADKETSDTDNIGIALSYDRANVKSLDSSKTIAIDSGQLNFYSSKNSEIFFLEGLAGFAWHQYNSSRSITAIDSSAAARFSGQSYVAKAKAGLLNKLKYGFNLTPETSLNFMRNDISAYNESGADTASLNVQAVSANFMEGRIGLNLGWVGTEISEFPEFNEIDSLLKISYGYTFINDAPDTVSNFSGQSSTFNSQVSQLDLQNLKLGTELDAYSEEGTTLSLAYDFERRATYQSHFVALNIRQEF